MSAPLSCCTPCATTETVNVPGVEGQAGTDGLDGENAYTSLTAQFGVPGANVQIPIIVASTLWMVVGQILIIGDGANSVGEDGWGHFQVISIQGATDVTVEYLAYPDDNNTDGVMFAGCTVSPAGVIGPAGP